VEKKVFDSENIGDELIKKIHKGKLSSWVSGIKQWQHQVRNSWGWRCGCKPGWLWNDSCTACAHKGCRQSWTYRGTSSIKSQDLCAWGQLRQAHRYLIGVVVVHGHYYARLVYKWDWEHKLPWWQLLPVNCPLNMTVLNHYFPTKVDLKMAKLLYQHSWHRASAGAVQTNSSYEFKIAFSLLHTTGGYLYNCAINNRANLTGEYRERLW